MLSRNHCKGHLNQSLCLDMSPILVYALTFVLSINSLCLHSATIPTSGNSTDQLALLALKDLITDDPLGALSSWNDSLHFCDWRGVTCSKRHRDRVIVLDLAAQKLEGTVSPHIGNLSFLTEIWFRTNNFRGPLPQEIGRLSRLRILDFSNNSFSGEIPTNISHCSDLRQLSLGSNQLGGRIPVELTTFPKLTTFIVSNNELRGTIPPSLGNLTSLTVLSLLNANLEESIPREFCLLQSLERVSLAGNNLTGTVPSCFYVLSNITFLSMAGNQLEGTVPSNIGVTLPNLQAFFVGMNKFSGTIPISLTNASNLALIGFDSNQFTGPIPRDLGKLRNLLTINFNSNQLGTSFGDDLDFIHSLTNCTELEQLVINDNRLKGPLPDVIANLSTQLTALYIEENQIYGSIPTGIVNLVNLEILAVNKNNLTGSIPTGIGKLRNMTELVLSQNRFSGQIPTSLGNLTQLLHLELSENEFHGQIPPSLGSCRNLLQLDVSYNKLNGTIPKQVIGLSSLRTALILSHNAFSGSLPSEVGVLNSLVILDVSGNKLSGSIPASLGDCLGLQYLNMEGNLFEGKIPESLKNLKGIQYLNLSSNKLSGEIPTYLANFTQLTYLNLSYNELKGLVPKDGFFANATGFSIVGNSELCGGVAELKLRPCPTKKNGKSLSLKVTIPVIVVILFFVLLISFLLMLYRRRMQQKMPSSPSLYNHQYPRLSYAELLHATNSFSADNLIGVGSYGSVYKGILEQDNSVVAVKVLNLRQPGATKSFLSECNALRNLRHRNLVKIITSCSSTDFQGNDFKALVYQLMPNGSLEDWLHQTRDQLHELMRSLNFLQRLNIAIDVASALDYLHNRCEPAVVHCDLKPSNILLDHGMTAHLSDFGLAKVFFDTSNSSSQTQANSIAIKGSIGYIAPEYGMGGVVSIQGDVYSYGILLLEMFTGKRPTNEIFQEGQNLHTFAKMALPDQVMSIVDPMILLEDSNETTDGVNQSDRQGRMKESVVSAIRLGITCSAESPLERMNMEKVLKDLNHIKEHYTKLVRSV